MNVVQNLVIKGFQPEACLVRMIKSLLYENKKSRMVLMLHTKSYHQGFSTRRVFSMNDKISAT